MLAIDPTSPFTGGAILGDRVRMQDHATDDGVFIRSMATRGHLGGLALATPEAVRLLDAVGHRLVLLETVGVGQVEVEVAGQADTTVVVVNPGWGDSVQANKAGLMEIADVFVINKADRDGVESTRATSSRCSSCRAPFAATVAAADRVHRGDGRRRRRGAVAGGRRPPRPHEATGRARPEAGGRGHATSCARRRAPASRRGRGRWSAMRRGPGSPTGVAGGELDPWSGADVLLGE